MPPCGDGLGHTSLPVASHFHSSAGKWITVQQLHQWHLRWIIKAVPKYPKTMIPQTRSGFSVLESAGVMSWRQEFLMLLSAVTATDGLQDAVKQPVAYADTQLQGSAGNSDGAQFSFARYHSPKENWVAQAHLPQFFLHTSS